MKKSYYISYITKKDGMMFNCNQCITSDKEINTQALMEGVADHLSKTKCDGGPVVITWMYPLEGDNAEDKEVWNGENVRAMIEVMQAYLNGAKIEARARLGKQDWFEEKYITWDWAYFEYRVKEEKND